MNIKRFSLLLLIALFFGFIIFKHYQAQDKSYKEITIIQVGAYKDYNNVIKTTKYFDNYIIHEEDGLYKIFIGLSSSEETYNKLIETYAKNVNVFKKVLKITDKSIYNRISDYDELIKSTTKKDSLNIIVKEELKLLQNILKTPK